MQKAGHFTFQWNLFELHRHFKLESTDFFNMCGDQELKQETR